jgi:23S rRNA (guanine745-N1)-methyltransferase
MPLEERGHLVVGCLSGHTFDVNKRGFLSLLRGGSGLIGDSPPMLDRRDEFLEAGWYDFLLNDLQLLIDAEVPRRIIDIGCGTGFYLAGILASNPEARALAMDISPSAVARTVRRLPHAEGLVADVWTALPVRDQTADVILNVFAPRNAPEFHRVLRPDGLLVVVVPQATHLQELRTAGLALDVQSHKVERLTETLSPWFVTEHTAQISNVLHPPASTVQALIGMGPSAHHHTADATGAEGAALHGVTAAFTIATFRRASSK